MNNQDKEAFEKWFKDFYQVDPYDPRLMNQSIAWKYACEYKQKEIDILKNHDIAGYKEGIDCLESENKKLRDVLESIANSKNYPEPDYLIAREALKEVGEK